MMMWGSGWWVGGLLWMVLFWGLLIAGVVWLVRATTDGLGRDGDLGSARGILDERFVAGELSVAEYRERREVVDAGR